MNVNAANNTNSTGDLIPVDQKRAADPSNPMGDLGKDAFLRLLVAQLRNQNPLSPMENQEFIGQMTQFSSLEQLTNISTNSEKSNLSSEMSQAVGMIGRDVTYQVPTDEIDEDGNPVMETKTSKVETVLVEDGKVWLRVGEMEITLDRVQQVT